MCIMCGRKPCQCWTLTPPSPLPAEERGGER